jgi:hypothetical protein
MVMRKKTNNRSTPNIVSNHIRVPAIVQIKLKTGKLKGSDRSSNIQSES